MKSYWAIVDEQAKICIFDNVVNDMLEYDLEDYHINAMEVFNAR